MGQSEIQDLAQRQLRDYDARTPGTVFAEPGFQLAIDDAYRVQIETARLRVQRGEAIAGYKIGCVSAAVRRQLGTEHAVFGHLFESELRTSPATLRASEFCSLAIEGELAVVLAADVEDAEEVRDDPRRFVRAAFPVIELHNHLFRGPSPSAAEVVANNALQAGVVSPASRPAAGPGGLLEVTVTVSDRIEETAAVNPSDTLPELAARLAAFGIKPKAGQMLLMGSPLPLYSVYEGECVRVECPNLAAIAAEVL